jgi:hypothetical protein
VSRALDLAIGHLRAAARDYATKFAAAEQLMLKCRTEELARGVSAGDAIEQLAGDVKRALDAINDARDAGDVLEAAALRFAARKRGRK